MELSSCMSYKILLVAIFVTVVTAAQVSYLENYKKPSTTSKAEK